MHLVKQIILSAILMLLLDFIYLSTFKSEFESQIVEVQRVYLNFKIIPAILCYVFLIFGLNYFILMQRRPVLDAFLFGLVIYAVYETTNMTIFKKWRWTTVFMDTLWGGVLMSLVTALIYAMH